MSASKRFTKVMMMKLREDQDAQIRLRAFMKKQSMADVIRNAIDVFFETLQVDRESAGSPSLLAGVITPPPSPPVESVNGFDPDA